MMKPQAIVDRFWAKVRKTDGWWLWTASKSRGGYGHIRCGDKTIDAHRVSWELHNEGVPEGLCVLHHCDTPACVKPEHLFLGTHADNVADKVLKGRASGGSHRPGESNNQCKLTDEQVLDIRSRRGQTQQSLATEFGLGQAQISRIRSGRAWTHVQEAA